MEDENQNPHVEVVGPKASAADNIEAVAKLTEAVGAAVTRVLTAAWFFRELKTLMRRLMPIAFMCVVILVGVLAVGIGIGRGGLTVIPSLLP